MTLPKNNGQGSIEAVISLPVLLFAVSTILVLLYRATVFYYADFHLHEALICSNHSSISDCESRLNQQVRKILWFDTRHKSTLRKKYKGMQGSVTIEFTPILSISQEVVFPLKAR